jgi:NAD(P)-dependent dehydrogenase (short-subunit alcohol dehydrogenase family)
VDRPRPPIQAENPTGSRILREKNAIVFGTGGSIGAAVAKEFVAEGAEVFLAGRTQSRVEDVTKHVRAAGGRAQVATRWTMRCSTRIGRKPGLTPDLAQRHALSNR